MINSEQENIHKDKEVEIEKRTIEELLVELRQAKNWDYINLMQELSNLGIIVDKKIIKKWELGIEYPNTDILYKFSELYNIPVENFIIAKNNSYIKGYGLLHMTFIKWFCYFLGLSLKVGYIIIYIFLYGALICAFMYFISQCNNFLKLRGVI